MPSEKEGLVFMVGAGVGAHRAWGGWVSTGRAAGAAPGRAGGTKTGSEAPWDQGRLPGRAPKIVWINTLINKYLG